MKYARFLEKENHNMTTTTKRLIPAALAAFVLCLGARAANEDKTWMVVDLRTGALSYYGYDLAIATNTFNAPVYRVARSIYAMTGSSRPYAASNATCLRSFTRQLCSSSSRPDL